MPYREIDVSRDQRAAQDIVRRTGQMGVPVTVLDGQTIIGFDRPRLDALLAARSHQASSRTASPPPFGAAVKAVAGGVMVGRLRPDSMAARSGLRVGDIITMVGHHIVSDAETLAHAVANTATGGALRVRRAGEMVHLSLASD